MIRGFTLHEMVDEFDLVNMNGRMYDAVFGRFVQPDNIIQDPDNTQNYNRYAYCFNNPLKFNDPTGHESVPGTEAALSTWYSNVGTAIYYANNPEYLGAYAPGTYAQYFPSNNVSIGGNDYNLNFNGSQDVSYQNIYTNPYASGGNNGEDFSLLNMYSHFLVGGGDPMNINASSIDFSKTNQRDLGLTDLLTGKTQDPVNLFNSGINSNSLAFGKVQMTRVSDTEFSIAPNTFDFDYQSNASWQRNAGTALGAGINYNLWLGPGATILPLTSGGPYDVYFNGTVTIPK